MYVIASFLFSILWFTNFSNERSSERRNLQRSKNFISAVMWSFNAFISMWQLLYNGISLVLLNNSIYFIYVSTLFLKFRLFNKKIRFHSEIFAFVVSKMNHLISIFKQHKFKFHFIHDIFLIFYCPPETLPIMNLFFLISRN